MVLDNGVTGLTLLHQDEEEVLLVGKKMKITVVGPTPLAMKVLLLLLQIGTEMETMRLESKWNMVSDLFCPWRLCLIFRIWTLIGLNRKPGYEAEDRRRGGRAVSRSPSGSRSRSVEVSPRWNLCEEVADQNFVQRFMGFAFL